MKRILVLFLVFLLLFAVLVVTSCEFGSDEFVVCKGLFLNEFTVNKCKRYIGTTVDILNDYGEPEITIISDQGKEGFITISYTIPSNADHFPYDTLELELEVFDGDTLVGRAAIRETSPSHFESAEPSIQSIIIHEYISGDYSFVIHSFIGWYSD